MRGGRRTRCREGSPPRAECLFEGYSIILVTHLVHFDPPIWPLAAPRSRGENPRVAIATREIVLTTCPRDCYDACGLAVVRESGAIVTVRGDPAHPMSRGKLCPKCSLGYNGVWRDPAARVTRPLRRVGPKGEGRFERVSWDEALGVKIGRASCRERV